MIESPIPALRYSLAARKLLAATGRILLVIALLAAATSAAAAAPQPASPQGLARYLIIENVGQFSPEARFLLKTGGRSLWLTDDAVWLDAGDSSGMVVRFTFPGANAPAALEPFGPVAADVSYLLGSDPVQWHSSVPVWAEVRYRDLYPGIDLVVGGSATGTVPWRLEGRAGADPHAVTLRVEGADALVDAGIVHLQAKGRSLDVAVPSWGASPEDMAPEAGDLIFNVTTGGNALDIGYGVAVDFAGSSYVTGETQSANFPTLSAYDGSHNGGSDVFVAKYDATGVLKYATYLGGSADDIGWGVAVEGNLAYVTGDTTSTNFPVIGAGVVSKDIFVAALTPSGSGLRYVARIGGNNSDQGNWIAVEGSAAYVVGQTYSTDLVGLNCAAAGATNAELLVAKLNSAGAPIYTTCLGGSLDETGYGIAARNGEAYVTGESMSQDFPGGLAANNGDLLVAHIGANGAVAAATLVGGSGEDIGFGIALDSAGNVYVGGSAGSYDGTTNNFPVTTATPYAGGANDGVVMRMTPALAVDFATYLGGRGEDDLYRIAVDTVQAIYVGGATLSDNFRTTSGAYDTSYTGGFDPFVARLHLSSTTTDKVTYATYLGAGQDDFDFGADTDTGGNAFVAGLTQTTADPVSSDVSLWKIKVSSPPAAPVVSIAISGADVALSWEAVSGAATYQAIRSETPYRKPGSTSAFLSRTGQGPTSQTDSGVVPQTINYYYVIKAVNDKPEAGPNANQVGKFTFSLVR